MTRASLLPLAAVALVAVAWPGRQPLVAQTRATATDVPVIPHEAVAGFFKNAAGIYTGESMGIATSSPRLDTPVFSYTALR